MIDLPEPWMLFPLPPEQVAAIQRHIESRVAARAPQLATVSAGHRPLPLYLCECGNTQLFDGALGDCSFCEGPGAWQPLYVLGEGAS